VIDGAVWIHRREGTKRSEKIDRIVETGGTAGAVITTMQTDVNLGMRGHWTAVAR